jgi:hypothetical protein
MCFGVSLSYENGVCSSTERRKLDYVLLLRLSYLGHRTLERGAQPGSSAAVMCGAIHGRARFFDRECRAALDPADIGPDPGSAAMDGERVRASVRWLVVAGRPGLRSLWSAADVHYQPFAVCGRLAAWRTRSDCVATCSRARGPGRGRGGALAGCLVPGLDDLSRRPRAEPRLRHLRRSGCLRLCHRRLPGRAAN